MKNLNYGDFIVCFVTYIAVTLPQNYHECVILRNHIIILLKEQIFIMNKKKHDLIAKSIGLSKKQRRLYSRYVGNNHIKSAFTAKFQAIFDGNLKYIESSTFIQASYKFNAVGVTFKNIGSLVSKHIVSHCDSYILKQEELRYFIDLKRLEFFEMRIAECYMLDFIAYYNLLSNGGKDGQDLWYLNYSNNIRVNPNVRIVSFTDMFFTPLVKRQMETEICSPTLIGLKGHGETRDAHFATLKVHYQFNVGINNLLKDFVNLYPKSELKQFIDSVKLFEIRDLSKDFSRHYKLLDVLSRMEKCNLEYSQPSSPDDDFHSIGDHLYGVKDSIYYSYNLQNQGYNLYTHAYNRLLYVTPGDPWSHEIVFNPFGIHDVRNHSFIYDITEFNSKYMELFYEDIPRFKLNKTTLNNSASDTDTKAAQNKSVKNKSTSDIPLNTYIDDVGEEFHWIEAESFEATNQKDKDNFFDERRLLASTMVVLATGIDIAQYNQFSQHSDFPSSGGPSSSPSPSSGPSSPQGNPSSPSGDSSPGGSSPSGPSGNMPDTTPVDVFESPDVPPSSTMIGTGIDNIQSHPLLDLDTELSPVMGDLILQEQSGNIDESTRVKVFDFISKRVNSLRHVSPRHVLGIVKDCYEVYKLVNGNRVLQQMHQINNNYNVNLDANLIKVPKLPGRKTLQIMGNAANVINDAEHRVNV